MIDADGNAAALSSTLGSGSGVFRGGTQLNNMLGELDVIGHAPATPGKRLPSMMTPTLVLENGRPRLALGSAGSVRLSGAIAQVADAVLRGAPVEDAIDQPRIHVEGEVLHLEGGLTELAPEGWETCAGRAATSTSAASPRSSAGPTGPSPPPATRAAAATGSLSDDLDPPARPEDAATLVALGATVGREPEAWLLNTDGWRSVTEERRYIRALKRHPDAACSSPRTTARSSAASRLPATRTPPAATSPTSA